MLAPDEIRALEDIVGPDWICSEPCMMDTYSFYMNPEIINRDGSLWLPRPEAVVMPKSTDEVAKILRLCNQLKIMAKPISTGWSAVAGCLLAECSTAQAKLQEWQPTHFSASK